MNSLYCARAPDSKPKTCQCCRAQRVQRVSTEVWPTTQTSSHQQRGTSDISANWSSTRRTHWQPRRCSDSGRIGGARIIGRLGRLETARNDSISIWIRLSLPLAFRAVFTCWELFDTFCACQFQWGAECHFAEQQQPGRICRSSKAVLGGLRNLRAHNKGQSNWCRRPKHARV